MSFSMFLMKTSKVKVQFKQLIEDTSSNAATENFGQLEQQLDEVLDDNAKNLIHEFWHGHALKNFLQMLCSV